MISSAKPAYTSHKDVCCTPTPHRWWIVDLIAVEAKGTATLIMVCTDCCETNTKVIKVGEPGDKLRLLYEEKQKPKQ